MFSEGGQCVARGEQVRAERRGSIPRFPVRAHRVVERLAALEVIIELGLQTYFEIGKALYEIREERLYRVLGFGTFEDYCRERWGWNSRQVPYNYIAASRVAENVQTTGQSRPSLSQAVELAALPAEQQIDVVRAIESYGMTFDGVSVREVREIVQEIQARTFALADNAALSELPQTPASRTGDLWLCGKHWILCGDSTRMDVIERVLGGGLADMIFADPPYSVSYTGKTARKLTIKNDDLGAGFYDFLREACANMIAVSKGAIYICMSSSELHTLHQAFTDAGGHWSTFVIWAKHHFTLGRSDYQRQYEPILYGWRKGVDHFWCGGRDQGDVWLIKRPMANVAHPTMKPVELVERAIRNSSRTHDTVLDLFAGSGTTMIACEMLERQARLIEVEPRYCDVAVMRWQQFTDQKATLDGDGRTFDQIAQTRLRRRPRDIANRRITSGHGCAARHPNLRKEPHKHDPIGGPELILSIVRDHTAASCVRHRDFDIDQDFVEDKSVKPREN
jgi:DNA modification methylase